MPELPEVETVRAGLDRFVVGRTVGDVEIRHPRAVRRHELGARDFAHRLSGQRIVAARRRGKYLWLPLVGSDEPDETRGECLVAHLGMSGQLLVRRPDAPPERHLHVLIRFVGGGRELRFVDQRTFGGLLVDALVPTADLPGDTVPARIAHIARDPLDSAFDDAAFTGRLRRRRTSVKRALLDQTLVSGVGNIYADEALWRARLHGERATAALTRPAIARLLAEVRAVLRDALSAGGTSFDALYVNVNGESGYFDRTLAVYGRAGQACPRCGAQVRRVAFMNRSSYFCPRCQPAPRSRRPAPSLSGAGARGLDVAPNVDQPLSQCDHGVT